MNRPKFSRFMLEQYLSGELSDTERQELEHALAENPKLAEQLNDLKNDIQNFTNEIPYSSFVVEHEKRLAINQQKLSIKRLFNIRTWWPSLTLAASATAVFILFVNSDRMQNDNNVANNGTTIVSTDINSQTHLKGSSISLSAHIQEPNKKSRPATAGEIVAAGTKVQLYYNVGNFSYMAIIGIDGLGNVLRYWPEQGEQLTPITSDISETLPFALTLDSTHGREEFIAVFATQPLPIDIILKAAQNTLNESSPNQARQLNLPNDVKQASFWLIKK
ncbi:MAG: hypothetical protein JW841_03005 [Deltaproteobacteria bacterium]|nr:hypothetical protein [Deltaproteobacteria bacterium]